RTDPAQVDVHGPDYAAAQHNGGGCRVVGNVVDDAARILASAVDQFEGGLHIFRGVEHIEQGYARSLQGFGQYEGQLDLYAGHDAPPGVDRVAVVVEHIIEQVPVVGLIDSNRGLHGLGCEPDLVAAQLGARSNLAFYDFFLDCVGIRNVEAREGHIQL